MDVSSLIYYVKTWWPGEPRLYLFMVTGGYVRSLLVKELIKKEKKRYFSVYYKKVENISNPPLHFHPSSPHRVAQSQRRQPIYLCHM